MYIYMIGRGMLARLFTNKLRNQHLLQVRKRIFLRRLYIKCINLPRQARDKHTEGSKKEWRFLRVQFRKHAAYLSRRFYREK
jgi:hypothetical protein